MTRYRREFLSLDPVWDIRLLDSEDLKREFREDSEIGLEKKLELLKKNFPRFVWNVSLFLKGKREVRILIDATDSGCCLNVMDVIVSKSRCLTLRDGEGAQPENDLMHKLWEAYRISRD